MKVVVRSDREPPAPLFSAANESQPCPGCIGAIELYQGSDGWQADQLHDPSCWWVSASALWPAAVLTMAADG